LLSFSASKQDGAWSGREQSQSGASNDHGLGACVNRHVDIDVDVRANANVGDAVKGRFACTRVQ
jgi:hypothetical protein